MPSHPPSGNRVVAHGGTPGHDPKRRARACARIAVLKEKLANLNKELAGLESDITACACGNGIEEFLQQGQAARRKLEGAKTPEEAQALQQEVDTFEETLAELDRIQDKFEKAVPLIRQAERERKKLETELARLSK